MEPITCQVLILFDLISFSSGLHCKGNIIQTFQLTQYVSWFVVMSLSVHAACTYEVLLGDGATAKVVARLSHPWRGRMSGGAPQIRRVRRNIWTSFG